MFRSCGSRLASNSSRISSLWIAAPAMCRSLASTLDFTSTRVQPSVPRSRMSACTTSPSPVKVPSYQAGASIVMAAAVAATRLALA